ncbi:hypothetical protein Drorol1_Dr00004773 [Drosera rotundifolia]
MAFVATAADSPSPTLSNTAVAQGNKPSGLTATIADFEQRLQVTQLAPLPSMAFVVTAADSLSPALSTTVIAQGNRPSGRNSYSTRRGGYRGSHSRGWGSGSRGRGQ